MYININEMIDAHIDRPNQIIEVLPQALPGPPKYPKLLNVFTSWPIYEELVIFLVVIYLHCDEVLIC